MRYAIQARETGDTIAKFKKYSTAVRQLEIYIQTDKEEGIYTPEFYDIVDLITGEVLEVGE